MCFLETGVEVCDFLRCGSSACCLAITKMVTCCGLVDTPEGGRRKKIKMVEVLNWTVLSAATSQPRDCITNVAIVFPTYLLAF